MHTVIAMYIRIHYDIMWMTSWQMNAWRLICAVIIVYINMHGDTYWVMSWHIDMPGNKSPEKVKSKLHIAVMKEIYGYCSVYTYKWL